jgi:hypothetical protein
LFLLCSVFSLHNKQSAFCFGIFAPEQKTICGA